MVNDRDETQDKENLGSPFFFFFANPPFHTFHFMVHPIFPLAFLNYDPPEHITFITCFTAQ